MSWWHGLNETISLNLYFKESNMPYLDLTLMRTHRSVLARLSNVTLLGYIMVYTTGNCAATYSFLHSCTVALCSVRLC
jgi:hypothetical protein